MLGLSLHLLPPPHRLQGDLPNSAPSWEVGRARVLLHMASPPSTGPFTQVPGCTNEQGTEPEQTFVTPR